MSPEAAPVEAVFPPRGALELAGRHPEALAEEAQVLGRGHVLVERVAVAQKTDLPAQRGDVPLLERRAVEADRAL